MRTPESLKELFDNEIAHRFTREKKIIFAAYDHIKKEDINYWTIIYTQRMCSFRHKTSIAYFDNVQVIGMAEKRTDAKKNLIEAIISPDIENYGVKYIE